MRKQAHLKRRLACMWLHTSHKTAILTLVTVWTWNLKRGSDVHSYKTCDMLTFTLLSISLSTYCTEIIYDEILFVNYVILWEWGWGSHDSEDVTAGLLGSSSVCTCRQVPTSWRNILFPSSGIALILKLFCVWWQVNCWLRYITQVTHPGNLLNVWATWKNTWPYCFGVHGHRPG
jgi:hypothetical protein